MRLRWLFVSPAERRLLGAPRFGGPTPWVIAIMSFSIMLIAASGLALASTAALVGHSIKDRYTLQLTAGTQNLDAVVKAVRSTPGVTSVGAVPESTMRQTLERWLGPAAESAELPVPSLIDFDAANESGLPSLEQRAQALSPGARIVAHRDSVGPLLRSLQLLQWVAFGLVLLLSTAASAAVVLAARGALDTHRFTIEVMHGIGATDLQVTHLFQRKILIDAFVGSLAGAAAATIVLLLLASGAALAGELMGGATLGVADLVILALLPLALTVLATWVARTAVLRSLRKSL